jgi:hypothetical protein
MRPWLKLSLLAVVTFGATWIGALWHWRSTSRMPTGADLALNLLALPLSLLAIVWIARKLPALLAKGAAATPADAAPNAPPEPDRSALTVVASALRAAHGQSAEELLDAIRSKQARLALDEELTDDDGYPIISARVKTVDEAEQEEAMAAWLDSNAAAQPNFGAEQWRALALGSAVVTELMQHAIAHKMLQDTPRKTPGAPALPTLPMLQLVLLLPARWSDAQRHSGGLWLLHLAQEAGWPAERMTLSNALEGASAFGMIDQLSTHNGQQGLLAIVLACDSRIGEDGVRDWAERGLLLTAKNPQGQVPGEGAAGLLLADPLQAALIDAAASVQLHAASAGRRASSADAKGRVDADLLSALSKTALEAGDADSVRLVTADSDQRPDRKAELMAMAGVALPQLDLASDVISVAASCGRAGAVSGLTALALAHCEVAANASQVLCVSNQDAYERVALIVRPENTSPT